jgi:hypothetical protein
MLNSPASNLSSSCVITIIHQANGLRRETPDWFKHLYLKVDSLLFVATLITLSFTFQFELVSIPPTPSLVLNNFSL